MNSPANLDELDEWASRPTPAVVEVLSKVDSHVLVIGAGGKMGFHLSRMIQRALESARSDFQVIAISRFGSPTATAPFDKQGIQTLSTDLTEDGSVQDLPDSKNIFFLAGMKFGTNNQPALLHQMNVELPRRIANHFPNSRIVALSTGCVYPFTTPDSGGATENDPVGGQGQYAVSCQGRENAFANSTTPTSLIRLNYSVDLRYGVLVDIAQKVLHEIPVDVTTGYANVIWQGDANAYIIQALPKAASPPFIVNVTGAATLRIREVATRFGELFEIRAIFEGTESGTAWLSNPTLSHKLWGPPSVDEQQLIEWVAAWLQQGGPTLDKPTHFEVRDGNY